MRTSLFAGLCAAALTGASLLTLAGPAQAADGTTLYVRPTVTTCSDTGPGTYDQPFCTIGAAASVVSAGQTVEISGGVYREHVTVTRSGTPDAPIVFRGGPSSSQLVGTAAGITIDGQHDIRIERIQVPGAADHPALDIRNAARITVEGGGYSLTSGATGTVVRLTGVTDSVLNRFFVSGSSLTTGIVLDEATSGVRLSSMDVVGNPNDPVEQSVGIRVEGPDNTIAGNSFQRFTGAAISVAASARGTTVANNEITEGLGYGVHNTGATGTAITNNTIQDRCRGGVRVEAGSTGVSVQNNRLVKSPNHSCPSPPGHGTQIAVEGGATADTVVDYNLADLYLSGSSAIYSWNGTPMGLTAFRAASGQAAHDLDTPGPTGGYDSANSAAPGFPATDRNGTARVDDPAVPNTGAGPLPYADRGAVETVRGPDTRFALTPNLDTGSVTVDASATVPGTVPIATYRFDFGDGTVVTQGTPIATHRYAARNTYSVSVRATGTDGRKDDTTHAVSVLPRTGTVGLLATSALRYVAPMANVPWPSLAAGGPDLGTVAQLDLVDAGDGKVALFQRSAGRYVSADTAGVTALTYQTVVVGDTERYTLVRNADGTVSLKSVAAGKYVTATANATTPLVANGKTIGTEQKFYRVNVADADRSFKAGANGKYVTAESAGAKPLIASRTSVGPWERFDLADLGNGQVGLFAHANNRFVCADNAGLNPLIANRTSAGAWETFTLIRNADGTVSLKATVNSRYVTADSGGAKPLIANRTAIGPWEKFTLEG
ncbi:right-handed parallel beta-helix repeat-containing protein [Micromonospora halotolerans]|uniref:Right-handed parallel beta-helix repeat-containing protein n=1 Tax=Micromonospora halotolerans TaxID=709879 RepID=A0ABZ0A4J2_9ACTN|nr:right-handed parallel beta-helix repeat-containing protein [Micromonospora halotolerans]WNM41760.1 right-handed parallel beta-helix repeat-containing protein [Micromonospora halotolerans]